MTPDAIFGVRDFLGMRPLCIGKIVVSETVTRYLIASESCAINTIGGQYIREVFLLLQLFEKPNICLGTPWRSCTNRRQRIAYVCRSCTLTDACILCV